MIDRFNLQVLQASEAGVGQFAIKGAERPDYVRTKVFAAPYKKQEPETRKFHKVEKTAFILVSGNGQGLEKS
jgi:hypothetical protein